MLGGVRLKVAFSHEKTCFAYISSKYSTNNEQTQCVQVLTRERHVYLWAVFNNGTPEGQIACNPVYSKLIGLEEGAEVFVSPYSDIKVLDQLYIDTDSPDDQEILEQNAELLQLRILDQLRLVVTHQKAIVWISASMPVIFTPKQTGILVNHSQIIVKVDAFNTHSSPNIPRIPDMDQKFKNIGLLNDAMLRPYLNIPKKLVLRAIPIDSDGKKNLIHPYTVFIHEDLIEDRYKDLTNILATMNNIPNVVENKDDDTENNNNHIDELCVEIVLVNSIVYRSLCREVYNKNIPTVLIPKSLNTIINVENGTRILFTFIGDTVEHPEHIDIITYTDQNVTESETIEKFKDCVIHNTHSGKKFLINNNMVKQNFEISSGYLQLKLLPEKLKYTMLNTESFRHCTVSAKCLPESELVLPKPRTSDMEYNYKNYCRTMKSMESLIEKVLSHIYFEIHREASFKSTSEIKSNVLVTGLSGTGKSAICHTIQKELTVYSHILHCRSLRGRKDIPEVLGKAVLMCQERSPAVLVCDDVDALVPSNMEVSATIGGLLQEEAMRLRQWHTITGRPPIAAETVEDYFYRLAVVIKQTLQSCVGVCVLMTSISTKSLHPALRQFNGKPLFTAQFTVPELGQEERMELFKHMLNVKVRDQFAVCEDDVTKMAMDTAGHSVREIGDYLNKKIFKAVKKKKSHPADSKPRLIEDMSKDDEKSTAMDVWESVGGLDDVKQALTESIFWPLMYPALFPSHPTGILLYGAPGTGKSHVGSCLARAHNLHMITVKGPELLSKYIGQSEAAVRDVFDKADMKRPCILFFDEFDSLAPKRGHDSTGVTDRVVNQLLTRLDGAEGGPRALVVAATARPDLLDPALLRPGRLHTHLCTTLPDTRQRHEVLLTLMRSVSVESSVDLRQIAAQTEGFTPADLKSLLVTAQLTALEQQLECNEDKSAMESVVVNQQHIDSALEETKPSLSPEQRTFYDVIYRRFRGEPLSTEQRIISNEMQKQRVTLA